MTPRRWADLRNLPYYEPLPASRVYDLFVQTWPPQLNGFVTIKPNLRVRVANTDIVQMVKLRLGKGAHYHLLWGVSLAFMPDRWWTEKPRWHRTMKSAHFDLFQYAGREYYEETGTYGAVVPDLRGEAVLRDCLAQTWEWAAPRMVEWFATTTTVPGVLRAAQAEMARVATDQEYRSPAPQLVAAFCLARLGQMDEAMALLQAYVEVCAETPVARRNLYDALTAVQRSNPT